MFIKNILLFAVFLFSTVTFAAYAPNGPFIGLGCNQNGGCMRWVPAAEASKVIRLSAGSTSVTAANYYSFHVDDTGSAAYQVAGTGALTCYGYTYISTTAASSQVGYADTSVSGSGQAGAPTNPVCYSGDTTCATFNSSAYRMMNNSTTAGFNFVPHTISFPANKYPFLRPGGSDTDVKFMFMDCYQN